MTAAQSTAIYQALKSGGFLDKDDLLRRSPDVSGLPVPPGARAELQNQLAASSAIHQAYSEAAPAVAAFFDAILLAPVSLPAPSVFVTAGGNFDGQTAAANSIVTLYSASLTPGAAVALRDEAGVLTPLGTAALAGQANLLLPAGAVGPMTLTAGSASVAVRVARLKPSLFTANGDAQDVAAAQVFRARFGGVSEPELTFRAGPNGSLVANPIVLGRAGESVTLVLYGTGLRAAGRASLRVVGEGLVPSAVDSLYAGETPGIPGLDQVNFLLPATWASAGETAFLLSAQGIGANSV